MHERRGGDVRNGGKGTEATAGGTKADGGGTGVSASGARGRPRQQRETDGEFGFSGGRETGNKRQGKIKINDVTRDTTNKLIHYAKAWTFTDPKPSCI